MPWCWPGTKPLSESMMICFTKHQQAVQWGKKIPIQYLAPHQRKHTWHLSIAGLVQERCNSIANALELHLSCTNPAICAQALNVHQLQPPAVWLNFSPMMALSIHLNQYCITSVVLRLQVVGIPGAHCLVWHWPCCQLLLPSVVHRYLGSDGVLFLS